MPSKAKPEELEKAIYKYLCGKERAVQLVAKLGIDWNNFYRWVKLYLAEEAEGQFTCLKIFFMIRLISVLLIEIFRVKIKLRGND